MWLTTYLGKVFMRFIQKKVWMRQRGSGPGNVSVSLGAIPGTTSSDEREFPAGGLA